MCSLPADVDNGTVEHVLEGLGEFVRRSQLSLAAPGLVCHRYRDVRSRTRIGVLVQLAQYWRGCDQEVA